MDGKITARERVGFLGFGVFLAGSDGCRAVEDADDAGKKTLEFSALCSKPPCPAREWPLLPRVPVVRGKERVMRELRELCVS